MDSVTWHLQGDEEIKIANMKIKRSIRLLKNMQMLIITVYVTMFVQRFEKIEPPIKEEIGYLETYIHTNSTIIIGRRLY